MAAPQSYANHVRRPPRMWSAALVLSLVATVLLITSAIRTPSIDSMALALLGVAVLFGITVTRLVATRLQDRVIRAEMLIRLGAIGRAADMRRLSMRQVVALRFASDAELPGLVDRTITENLTADAIKRAVTDWQADLIRV
jgi:hypothetical protein